MKLKIYQYFLILYALCLIYPTIFIIVGYTRLDTDFGTACKYIFLGVGGIFNTIVASLFIFSWFIFKKYEWYNIFSTYILLIYLVDVILIIFVLTVVTDQNIKNMMLSIIFGILLNSVITLPIMALMVNPIFNYINNNEYNEPLLPINKINNNNVSTNRFVAWINKFKNYKSFRRDIWRHSDDESLELE